MSRVGFAGPVQDMPCVDCHPLQRLWRIPVEEVVLLRIAGTPVVKQSLLQDMVSWQLFGELFVPAAA